MKLLINFRQVVIGGIVIVIDVVLRGQSEGWGWQEGLDCCCDDCFEGVGWRITVLIFQLDIYSWALENATKIHQRPQDWPILSPIGGLPPWPASTWPRPRLPRLCQEGFFVDGGCSIVNAFVLLGQFLIRIWSNHHHQSRDEVAVYHPGNIFSTKGKRDDVGVALLLLPI